jgi:flagellar basal body-associated protein FliL
MIRVVLLGVWLCVVTIGSAYGVMSWQQKKAETEAREAANSPETLEQMHTSTMNVPVIKDGAVQGYVLAQFVFTVESKKLKTLSTKPELVVVDEAFKLIYTGSAIDFRHLRRNDIAALCKLIQENVNKRFGDNLVREVLVQQLNYLPRDQVRGSG